MPDIKGKIHLRLLLFYFVTILLGVLFLFVALELVSRLSETKRQTSGVVERVSHETLGWVEKPGKGREIAYEFKANFDVNSYGMNDKPIEESVGIAEIRIMALGDSHTFAVGVSTEDSWPNVLERIIFKNDVTPGSVYNCAVPGYSLGQYLVRMRQTAPILKPQMVLIGFSIATDLYDLIPPRKGGFVYAGDRGRIYFDLDDKENLVEFRDLVGKKIASSQKISFFIWDQGITGKTFCFF